MAKLKHWRGFPGKSGLEAAPALEFQDTFTKHRGFACIIACPVTSVMNTAIQARKL